MNQLKETFRRNQFGFSLIELLIYLAILGILMTAVVASFTQTMQRSAQQSNIAETKIETGVGLELLRADLEHTGFGLPWRFQTTPVNISEPAALPIPNGATDIPRALSSQDASGTSVNSSDYLIIRATNVTRGISGQKWGYVGRTAGHAVDMQSMSTDAFDANDRVIVIRPESSPGEYRQLVMDGTAYVTTTAAMVNFAPDATPNDPNGERYLVYGLDNSATINRPFNRTDYYIDNTNVPVPTHCSPNTGVLVKMTVNQDNNTTVMPIVDCVADFQIVYYLDTNGDGGWDQRANANGLTGLSAEQIRDQVKAIRYYLLSHEGTIDRSYIHPNTTINVGEVASDGVTLMADAGRPFNLSTTIGGNWANYRWKVDSMAVTPKNLK